MNAPVRFAYANARLHALKNDLYDVAQLDRMKVAPELCPVPPSDDFAELYPPLVRWYLTLLRACPAAAPVLLALLRRHEVENLKLLWRCTVRRRDLPARCWRTFAELATLDPALVSDSVADLVEHLRNTPYAALAAETWRSHGSDLVAAELAFDGWAGSRLYDEAAALSDRESPARDLLLAVVLERDVDLLRRGCDGYRLEPAFVVGLTTLLRRQHARDVLMALAVWRPSSGSLMSRLPAALAREAGGPRDWSELEAGLRRRRVAACRRALLAYPFQLAPTIAAIILREDQMRVWSSLGARRELARGAGEGPSSSRIAHMEGA